MKRKIADKDIYDLCTEEPDARLYFIDGEVVLRMFEGREYSIEEVESILREMKRVQDAADNNDYFKPAVG